MTGPDDAGTDRLDRLVAAREEISRARAQRLIRAGRVRVAGQVVERPSTHVDVSESVDVDLEEDVVAAPVADPSVDFVVAYEDDDVIVVDKPAGIVVHPGHGNQTHTLVNGLLARYPELGAVGEPERPGLVHRLDAGTSGLLIIGRNAEAHAALVAALRRREISRRYVTLTEGRVAARAGRIEAPVGRSPRAPTRMAIVADGRPATTHYEVERRWSEPERTLLACRLETGRTHQIRVHLESIGHPVVGDPVYSGPNQAGLDRPFLHARALDFAQPRTGEALEVRSSLPADLSAVLDALDAAAATPP